VNLRSSLFCSHKGASVTPRVQFILFYVFIKSRLVAALFNGIDDVIKLQADTNSQNRQGG